MMHIAIQLDLNIVGATPTCQRLFYIALHIPVLLSLSMAFHTKILYSGHRVSVHRMLHCVVVHFL